MTFLRLRRWPHWEKELPYKQVDLSSIGSTHIASQAHMQPQCLEGRGRQIPGAPGIAEPQVLFQKARWPTPKDSTRVDRWLSTRVNACVSAHVLQYTYPTQKYEMFALLGCFG